MKPAQSARPAFAQLHLVGGDLGSAEFFREPCAVLLRERIPDHLGHHPLPDPPSRLAAKRAAGARTGTLWRGVFPH
jgi:hypothetical protein